MKYTFLVRPGADPGRIQLAYHGATTVALNEAGQLEVTTTVGSFRDKRPVAWQEGDGERVAKEIIFPASGVAAVGQRVRFLITIENDGATFIPAVSLRDTYDPWCLIAVRAETPPDDGGGGTGFIQWDDLGPLAVGEALTVWVEFDAVGACGDTVNHARAEGGGVFAEDEAPVRVLAHTASIGGHVCHDQDNDGLCGLDEPGVEGATVELQRLATGTHDVWLYTTNTSGWYSFNGLAPGDYLVRLWPLEGWTATTPTEYQVTISSN